MAFDMCDQINWDTTIFDPAGMWNHLLFSSGIFERAGRDGHSQRVRSKVLPSCNRNRERPIRDNTIDQESLSEVP
jgi:hypothetical protein